MKVLHVVPVACALLAAGCSEVGYLPLRAGGTPTDPAALFISPERDVGRPYEAIGWVYFLPMMRGDGLREAGGYLMEIDPASPFLRDFLGLAAANGADAILALRISPVLNGFLDPIAFGLTGLAVRFTGPPPTVAPPPPPSVPAP